MSAKQECSQPKNGPHTRVRWGEVPSLIRVHGQYAQLLGNYKRPQRTHAARRERYNRAKKQYDLNSAFEIVDEIFSIQTLDRVIDDYARFPKAPCVVMPHPEWDSGAPVSERLRPTNALPFAYAERLARELGGEVCRDILQVARPGRTKLKDFQRFIWQPRFEGIVRHDCAYILVDDVCHFGGTLAALRSYIVENGGTVVSASTLACNDGKDSQFPIADRTVRMLKDSLDEALDEIWREEIGHDTECLTENEGVFLLRWREKQPNGDRDALLQRVREEIAAARAS